MITLYAFGPAFGLPDPSPFVMKAEMLLKLAGLQYRTDTTGFRSAPKGKLPYIDDGGTIVADSTFIRWHLEKHYQVDFDSGLSASERGIAWAVEKLLEDNMYWVVIDARWINQENFAKGPSIFFRRIPWPMRPIVTSLVRRKVASGLKSQGMGRHAPHEIAAIADKGVQSLAAILGDKPYLMGDRPCGADATAFAFTVGFLCPLFQIQVRESAERHPNLVAYADRMLRQYYPEFLRAKAGSGA